MNSDVAGNHDERDPAVIISEDLSFFDGFTLVVASQLSIVAAHQLAEYCWAKQIPLILIRACGLVGSVRIVVRHHTIVESKPSDPVADLRVAHPFPELEVR